MSVRRFLSDAWCRLRYPQLSVSFAITSHLTYRERVALYETARRPGIRSIVEIGSYMGASAAAFARGLRDAGNGTAHVHCVDTWNNDAMSDGPRDTMQAFLDNTRCFGDAIVPQRGWSTEVAALIASAAAPIDVLFVDGDHSYQGCLADWQAYAPLLAPEAWVAFHDVGWAEGVQRVVAEFVRPRAKYAQQLPNLWCGQLR
jgi:predicted O-methyltransferase YrrM